MDGHLRDHLAYYYDQAGFALSPAAAEERVGQALRVARLALLEAGRKGDAVVLELAAELLEHPSPAPRVALVLPELPEPLKCTARLEHNKLWDLDVHGTTPSTLEATKALFPGATWETELYFCRPTTWARGTWKGVQVDIFLDTESAKKTRKSRRAA